LYCAGHFLLLRFFDEAALRVVVVVEAHNFVSVVALVQPPASLQRPLLVVALVSVVAFEEYVLWFSVVVTNIGLCIRRLRNNSSLKKTTTSSSCGRISINDKKKRTTTSMASSSAPTAEAKASASPTPTTSATPKYDALLSELDELAQLSRILSVLEYDKMVFMPHEVEAQRERGKQSAALTKIAHSKKTDPALGLLIKEAEREIEELIRKEKKDGRLEVMSRNVELAKIEYQKETCVPAELASKRATLRSESYGKWNDARNGDDFAVFRDCLGRCIELAKEIADCKRRGLAALAVPAGTDDGAGTDNAHGETKSPASSSLYAQMLDEYETGMDPNRVDGVFREIKTALAPLIDRVFSEQATPPSEEPLTGPSASAAATRKFDVEKQKELCRTIATKLGYDSTKGRIDVSVHPFTMSLGGPTDVRITSRFRDDEWYQGLFATVHEAGHAMYEQNMMMTTTTTTTTTSEEGTDGTAADKSIHTGNTQPVASALSMGMHESQSLFWERHVALSEPFWKFAAPLVNAAFGSDDDSNNNGGLFQYTPEEYYGAVNACAKSFSKYRAASFFVLALSFHAAT